jgi:hypothetical protein
MSEATASVLDSSVTRLRWGVTPALAAAIYPFVLDAFRAVIAWPDGGAIAASLLLMLAFAVPGAGLAFAYRSAGLVRPTVYELRARRLGYIAIAVPPLYVLTGVLFYMAGTTLLQEWSWFALWMAAGAWVAMGSNAPAATPRALPKLRVAHGWIAAALLVFVLFHLANHASALIGKDAHTAVMAAGRTVYRAAFVEPILIGLLLAQVASGVAMAWRLSAQRADRFRVLQIASGFYLGAFILTHLNSVLILARLYLHIPTDWAFMTGAPKGLIHGSIHLVPHYALGVFFVLAHVVSGLRNVALRRGMNAAVAGRLWTGGSVVSAVVMTGIAIGITEIAR